MKKPPEDPSTVAAIKAWRKMPRAARRAAWRQANRLRPVGSPRAPWNILPLPSPLQRHVLAGKAHPQSQKTRAVSLGFSRAQRRAMVAKKGSRRMLTPVWGVPKKPGSVKSRPTSSWAGTWNKFSLRLEFNRRLRTHAEEYRRENTPFKRALRWILRLWKAVLRRLSR